MKSGNYFDQVAHQWDRLRESFFSEAVRDKALSVASVQEGRIAADIGCGTGFITEGLVQRGLKVIAVDGSESMLSQMKQKFADLDLIDYRLGEAGSLPIQDEAVDYAFANMYLHHVEFPPEAIKEMVRICKPGGMLVITDLDAHRFEFLRREHNDRWMGFARDDIQRWFEEAGLQDVSVECVGEDCCASSSCGSERAKISIFVASGKK
ncbi:MAG: class I SAM-dependent methyltransferase [Methanothrix sp.]|nr:class I SAM-dependent methyltransferase [Methanothrix sp.]